MSITDILEVTVKPNTEHPDYEEAAKEIAESLYTKIICREYIYHSDYHLALDPETVGLELWDRLTDKVLWMFSTDELKDRIDSIWSETRGIVDTGAETD